jgi:hypothetical protein
MFIFLQILLLIATASAIPTGGKEIEIEMAHQGSSLHKVNLQGPGGFQLKASTDNRHVFEAAKNIDRSDPVHVFADPVIIFFNKCGDKKSATKLRRISRPKFNLVFFTNFHNLIFYRMMVLLKKFLPMLVIMRPLWRP